MANFCEKCGSPLDKTTGLCPNCDGREQKLPVKKDSLPKHAWTIILTVFFLLGATAALTWFSITKYLELYPEATQSLAEPEMTTFIETETTALAGMKSMEEEILVSTQTVPSEATVSTEVEKTDEEKDGELALEVLNTITSWKQLQEYFSEPLVDWFKMQKNEDDYIENFAKHLPMIAPNSNYSSDAISGSVSLMVNLKNVNYDRLMQKYRKVADIYNEYGKWYFTWETKEINEEKIQIDVKSIRSVPIVIGKRVMLRNGTKYWTSDQIKYNGKWGFTLEASNFISENLEATVDGFAHLDAADRTIIEISCMPNDELEGVKIQVKPWREPWYVHVCTENGNSGWVDLADVLGLDCK